MESEDEINAEAHMMYEFFLAYPANSIPTVQRYGFSLSVVCVSPPCRTPPASNVILVFNFFGVFHVTACRS